MFSSDKNIESISQLIEDIKHYIGLQKEFVKLDVVEKTVILLSTMILGAILLILGAMVLFYLSFTAAFFLSQYANLGQTGGFAIITVFCLLLFFLVYRFRNKWIQKPITRFLARLLLHDKDNEI